MIEQQIYDYLKQNMSIDVIFYSGSRLEVTIFLNNPTTKTTEVICQQGTFIDVK